MADKPKVELYSGKLEYTQESDCCGDDGISQVLTVSSWDGGGGKYFTIESDRWAFDNISELIATLEDAAKRLGIDGKETGDKG